jgi:hypothetical protein
MEIFLFLSLLIQALGLSLNQSNADPPDVEVLNFSWSHNRPITTEAGRTTGSANPARREYDYRREMANRNSIENRSRDMLELEENAARETRKAQSLDMYKYRIELKNRGSRVIKWVFVDYQTSEVIDHDNPSHRQFACAVKIGPDQSKVMEGYSNLPPNRVISAANPDKPLNEQLVINRIEYSNGEIWQRTDWQAPDKIPARSSRGQCRPF